MTGFGLTGGLVQNEALPAGAWGAQRSVIVHPRHIAVITLRVCARDWRPPIAAPVIAAVVTSSRIMLHPPTAPASLTKHNDCVVAHKTRREGGQAGRLNTVVA